MKTLSEAVHFGRVADQYTRLRYRHPTVAAAVIKGFIDDDLGLNFEQYRCETEVGHDWATNDHDHTYCLLCGADGDG